MVAQQSFASLAWARKGKVTRRERFLAEMDEPAQLASSAAFSSRARNRPNSLAGNGGLSR